MAVNIRARRQLIAYPALPKTTLIARPLLAIAGITRTSAGAVLPQANVRAFRTLTDVLVSREISDPLGQYTVSTFDSGRYYVVALQPATVDTATITTDNVAVTVDRTKSTGGVGPNTLMGTS